LIKPKEETMRRVAGVILLLWMLAVAIPQLMAQVCTNSNTILVNLVDEGTHSQPINGLTTTLCFRITAPSAQIRMLIDSEAELDITWRQSPNSQVGDFDDVHEMLWSMIPQSDGSYVGELSVSSTSTAQVVGTISLSALVQGSVDAPESDDNLNDFDGELGTIPSEVLPFIVTLPAFGGTIGVPIIVDCAGQVTVDVVVQGIREEGDVGFLNDSPRPRETSSRWNESLKRLTFTVTYRMSEDERFHAWTAYAVNTTNRDINMRIGVPEPECIETVVLVVPTLTPQGQPQITATTVGGVISVNNATLITQISTLTGHTQGVTGVAFSPDGRYVISSSDDQTLILWDAAAGSMIRQFSGHGQPIEAVAYSPDGQTILSGAYDNQMILWDVNTGQIIRRYAGHSNLVESVAYSPDGNYLLSGSADQTMILWDKASGSIIHQFSGHTGGVEGVAYSPSGNRIISASLDGTARLWDLSGQLLYEVTSHNGEVESAAFSPDGSQFLTSSDDQSLILWDTALGSMIRQFFGHTNSVESVSFSPSGELFVSGGQDNAVMVWSIDDSQPVRILTGHTQRIDGVDFSNDGRYIVSASIDQTVRIWGIDSPS
jgi:WD40 repeat protein